MFLSASHPLLLPLFTEADTNGQIQLNEITSTMQLRAGALSRASLWTPANPALGKQRQDDDHEFKSSLHQTLPQTNKIKSLGL